MFSAKKESTLLELVLGKVNIFHLDILVGRLSVFVKKGCNCL